MLYYKLLSSFIEIWQILMLHKLVFNDAQQAFNNTLFV